MKTNSSRKKSNVASRLTTAHVQASPYPFSAIVGQEEMKLALILNTIDPLIGGVLIMGHRGTGKSTAVRALADLLPELDVVEGCVYNCDPQNPTTQCLECKIKDGSSLRKTATKAKTPVVELPLGATEDRVCGTISIERALQEGVKSFEPGLLARANRGFFYIDEVNLLEDHLVDLLLDVATTGWNRVERESVSVEHPAHFVLIGSGNPEEGDLRPQLLDRFGLNVEITTEDDVDARVQVIQRRDRYDRDPIAFRRSFADQQGGLERKIVAARNSFAGIEIPRPLLTRIAQLCIDLKVDGHRGELTIMRAARALAAFEERSVIDARDVMRVATMALRHRLGRNPLENTASGDRIDRAVQTIFSGSSPQPAAARPGEEQEPAIEPESESSDGEHGTMQIPSPAPVRSAANLPVDIDSASSNKSDKTGRRPSVAKRKLMNAARGRHSRSVSQKLEHSQIALAATLRSVIAAGEDESNSTDNLRYKLYSRKKGTLFILAIDSSGSMGQNRIAVAKRVMLDRLQMSYVNRDTVAIVCFGRGAAGVALMPTRSILRARRVLDSLRIGGSTPLSAGLASTLDLIKSVGNTHGEVVVLLFTDGRGNVSITDTSRESREAVIASELKQLAAAIKHTGATAIVVDTKREFESSDDTRYLAEQLQGRWIRIRQNQL